MGPRSRSPECLEVDGQSLAPLASAQRCPLPPERGALNRERRQTDARNADGPGGQGEGARTEGTGRPERDLVLEGCGDD